MAEPVEPVITAPVETAAPVPVGAAQAEAAPIALPVASADPVKTEPVEANPVEAAPEPAKPESAHDTPTLLEEHGKPEAKPAEKPAEAKPEDKPAEPVVESPPLVPEQVEYKYTLPDTISMDDAVKGDLHKAFDEFRANPAEGAQKLIDLHDAQMRKFAEHAATEQHRVFADTRKGWRTEVMADSEVGGAGHQTAMTAIARVRDAAMSSAKIGSKQHASDTKAFNDFLRITGAGDHPAFLRFMHNMARFIDEPQAASVPTDIKPPKGNGRAPKGIYSHPTSANMER